MSDHKAKSHTSRQKRSRGTATGSLHPIVGYDSLMSQGHLHRILDIADDAIISTDQSQKIILFNQGAEKIFGYSASEVVGKRLDVLLPATLAEAHRNHFREFSRSSIAARRMGERGEIVGRRKDGAEFPAEASISQVEVEGVQIYTVILRDITTRKAAESKIRASLEEKEVLLQEIHHRVKNNLQVVSSLLNLQSRGIDDEETRQKFKESQNRVQSMALIHEQLYQSDNLSEIDFPKYIRQLAAHLFRSYQVSASRIDLETDIEDIPLGINVAVPCGLVINELLSNALKYAFPEGKGGRVKIRLFERENGYVSLSVADDGVGIPPEIGFWNAKTLGLRLVRTLVHQLEGGVEIERSGGTEIVITFLPEHRQAE